MGGWGSGKSGAGYRLGGTERAWQGACVYVCPSFLPPSPSLPPVFLLCSHEGLQLQQLAPVRVSFGAGLAGPGGGLVSCRQAGGCCRKRCLASSSG